MTEHQSPDVTPVAVIGLGLMGQALAGAFLGGGAPTTVWNRTASKGDALVAAGARRAGSAREAVEAVGPDGLVVLCLTDYDAVREVLEPLGGVLAGRVLVNLTSGTSAAAREVAELMARTGGAYLDGAIMATPDGIGADDAAVLVSGDPAAWDRYGATLRLLGGGTARIGADHGLAALYEMGVLGLMWGVLNGFLHGAALLGAAGVSAEAFAPVARHGIGTVAGWLTDYARRVDAGDHASPDATLETHLATMDHLVHESEALGVDAELPRFVRELARRAAAAGHGGDEYSVMADVFRGRVGAPS
ncbi:NAD(P)-dependent oxidoreductase [Streptomyces genisteinicus]|uniref:NAD(P)-dependent oxidoreductase n=1 Tax=Streptomyces genisteinicus TaxID=2768068 RepID=A0A7H0I054_9ACTN|nr:NAD(P)-binding domain-containing protein [Streptomyces genisteinicus]QNP66170.1 NAD(P)-dependent oxidoreductase [Streptomyces genisteinicus]